MGWRIRELPLSEIERRHTSDVHANVRPRQTTNDSIETPVLCSRHKFWGKTIFLLGVAAALMGITEYAIL